jgi:hypothetical protein
MPLVFVLVPSHHPVVLLRSEKNSSNNNSEEAVNQTIPCTALAQTLEIPQRS